MPRARPCPAPWWRSGSATPSAATATPETGRTGAIRASRGAGVWLQGRTAPMPSALSGRCRNPGRTPHIHAAVAAPGREPLVTQFYVAGEPLNERDGLFNALRDPRQREAVLLHLEPAERIETGALLASRDVVLG